MYTVMIACMYVCICVLINLSILKYKYRLSYVTDIDITKSDLISYELFKVCMNRCVDRWMEA